MVTKSNKYKTMRFRITKQNIAIYCPLLMEITLKSFEMMNRNILISKIKNKSEQLYVDNDFSVEYISNFNRSNRGSDSHQDGMKDL